MPKVRVFGNLTNRLMEASQQPVPAVGMGATILSWSDRTAATIVAVGQLRRGEVTSVTVQTDIAKRTGDKGPSDCQSYDYTPNPAGILTTFTKRQDGSWVKRGDPLRNGQRILIGHRDQYFDYSF